MKVALRVCGLGVWGAVRTRYVAWEFWGAVHTRYVACTRYVAWEYGGLYAYMCVSVSA